MKAVLSYLYALICSVYAFTIGFLISGRARRAVWSIASHFGYHTDKATIPSIRIDDLFDDHSSISISSLASRDGNVTIAELSVIAGLVRSQQPRSIFEIGTYDGRTALNMALNAPADCRVFTLDLPKSGIESTRLHISTSDKMFVDKDKSGARFQGTDQASRIVQLYGDSATFDFSPYLNDIDVVFVDGSHTYEYLRNDTQKALQLLRNGNGIIIWHDYRAWPGVTKGLEEFYLGGGSFAEMRHVEGTSLVILRQPG